MSVAIVLRIHKVQAFLHPQQKNGNTPSVVNYVFVIVHVSIVSLSSGRVNNVFLSAENRNRSFEDAKFGYQGEFTLRSLVLTGYKGVPYAKLANSPGLHVKTAISQVVSW